MIIVVRPPGAVGLFGEVADEHDDVRAGYPAALVDTGFRLPRRATGRDVETGAGTGKAMVALAARAPGGDLC